MLAKPHVYGIYPHGRQKQGEAEVIDFALCSVVNGGLKSVGQHLTESIAELTAEQIDAMRDELISQGVLPVDAELYDQKTFEALHYRISPERLRKDLQHIVDQVCTDELDRLRHASNLDDATRKAMLSDIQRTKHLLSGEKPLSMLEAVRDFLEMGPCGEAKERTLILALDDLNERVCQYQEQPSSSDVDMLITNAYQIGSEELRTHPERLHHADEYDAEERIRSIGPEPM